MNIKNYKRFNEYLQGTSEGLLPCPFCGKYPNVFVTNKGLFYLECCFIRKFGYTKTIQNLAKNWNKRIIL